MMAESSAVSLASPILRYLCSALRGDPLAGWPAALNNRDGCFAMLDAAEHHGVVPLLDWRLSSGSETDSPDSLRAALRARAIELAKRELAVRAETTQVLAALESAGIRPVILKGAALAYSLYPTPALRPRADLDILVAPDERDSAWQILLNLG